ncbi:MAG: DNA translocase FtsK [Anaerolineae bacterium]|nr:DNA translocase FtsK [Anaerolineae bacterium]MDW8102488.1 DNA translocase FtsK [Anaerolineae bacterium]
MRGIDFGKIRGAGPYALMALGILSFISVMPWEGGIITNWFGKGWRFLFGLGAVPASFLFAFSGWSLRKKDPPWRLIAGLELCLFSSLALIHLLWPTPDPLSLAYQGGGGGYVGWAISSSFAGIGGKWGGAMALLAFVFLGINLIASQRPAPTPEPSTQRRPKPSPAKSKAQPPLPERPPPQPAKDLPPMELLNPPRAAKAKELDLERKAQLLERTLANFNIPAKVVAINPGPVVTQFGVEPGFVEKMGKDGKVQRTRVRVAQIVALADDIALALSAAPIRIEAPVPGRPYIGIEVPNQNPALVTLREVMESREFRQDKSPLKLALGRGVSGAPVVADLASMPHLLIAGATGSGKSVCINSIVVCLVSQHPPERLRLILVDPKRVELVHFNGLPHLLGSVIVEVGEAIKALNWLVKEMGIRYEEFARVGARNLEEYNAGHPPEPMPWIVLIVDELADLMLAAPDEVEGKLTRLAQLSRATGIHIVLSTQRPSVDVITGLIKANFPARISFLVTSQVDSRVILDTAGAERLLGKGDMLFLPPDRPYPIRVQGCYVSKEEVKKVVDFWRARRPFEASAFAPWSREIPEEEEDELVREALGLLASHQRLSISLLQRKLRLGYPKAARLMETLEEKGYVRYDENLRAYIPMKGGESDEP